ncbi:hypothetical protein QTP86_005083 [Hemibagrus guttatus]|nr:hypothetical protein QTP86_005083 [Hemibagrus guttatus]
MQCTSSSEGAFSVYIITTIITIITTIIIIIMRDRHPVRTLRSRESNCSHIPDLLLRHYISPMYAVEFAIGFLGNLFVILGYVFCLPSWQSSNVYMFNLAISDLICLCTLPLLSYNYLYSHKLPPVSCVAVRYILHINLYASILFMAWVGVDRSLLVFYPQRNHSLLTWKASLLISFLNWIWVTLELIPYITFIIIDLKETNGSKCNDFSSMSQTTPVLIYNMLLTTVAYVLPLLTLYLFSNRMVSLLKKREKMFVNENGVSKPKNTNAAIYQPPSLKAVQKMAQAHIKSPDTPASESSDNEDVSSTSPSGPGRLAVINGTMNSAVYQKILKENVQPSVSDLKLKQTWVLQHDNDPKHTSKSTSEWLKKNKKKTLEWPSQSPDLNPIEMLWHDLKKVVHARKPSNVAELQQFCKDEWAKIPPQRCNRLIAPEVLLQDLRLPQPDVICASMKDHSSDVLVQDRRYLCRDLENMSTSKCEHYL